MVHPRFTVKSEGKRKYLIIDYRGTNVLPSLADSQRCMKDVIEILMDIDATNIVLTDVYERVYNEEQTIMLREIAELVKYFYKIGIWSPKYIGDCERDLPRRHEIVVRITQDFLKTDPIKAYLLVIEAIKKEEDRLSYLSGKELECAEKYINTLKTIKKKMEATGLIKRFKEILSKTRELPGGRAIYHTIFEARLKPAFISSKVLYTTPEKIELIDSYTVEDAVVHIYKHPDKIEYLYQIDPPEYNLDPDKYFLMVKTKSIVSKHHPEGIDFRNPEEMRQYMMGIYERTISDLADMYKIQLTKEEKEMLTKIVVRYTIGYGILELLLRDRRLTDVYIDAPLESKPIYVVHSQYGTCETNIILSEQEARSFISRLRALSGRPFDEAHPVLDYDMQDLQVRVAAIGPPLSTDGIAFALRLHKTTPWTLPQFVDVKMIDEKTAGLLSFLIDSQASTLVNGARGSGKTSMLMALMLEINPSLRILVQEDTHEIPVLYMKELGFHIQRLKTQSAIAVARTSAEVPPEEALRTALRLGDSVLIVGEVRSKEALVLYEAMRVGAIGNVVMGTIHGENAYSVWDRIVNDLGVPTTSFKATDIIVTCAPIRFKGSLKRERRLLEITEVTKHWYKDPEQEGGLVNLLEFDVSKDKHVLLETNFKQSELIKRISKRSGLKLQEIVQRINALAESKGFLVEAKKRYNIPQLLEAENTVKAHTKFQLMEEKHRETHGSVDYQELLKEWKKWVVSELVKPLVKK